MTLIEVNEANFESEVLQSTVPVAVDFYGEQAFLLLIL